MLLKTVNNKYSAEKKAGDKLPVFFLYGNKNLKTFYHISVNENKTLTFVCYNFKNKRGGRKHVSYFDC